LPEDAMQIAERLRHSIAAAPFYIGRNREQLEVTCSVGVSVGNQVSDIPETVLKRADQALYSAKQCGRNRVMAQAA